MITKPQDNFTVTGILQLAHDLPVEGIGASLMDAAAEVDVNAAVCIDIERARIEIETIVHGSDELEALTAAKKTIHEICDQAALPVDLAPADGLRPREWHLIDDAAVPPELAPA